MDMTPDRWSYTCRYLQEVFGREDEQLATLMPRAVKEGLPDIAVSAEVGRLLKMLAGLCGQGRGAQLIVEVGTLAGYSGIWLARGMRAGGRLITIEIEGRHVEFARAEFERAGVGGRVEVRHGAALEVLPRLAGELNAGSVDLAFIDGVKTEYPEYFRLLKPLIRPGGMLVADNILGSSWWIDQESDPMRRAVDGFNRMVAGDPEFEAVGIPVRQGVMIARKK
jgi:predicted O-methyltransferase YrrM